MSIIYEIGRVSLLSIVPQTVQYLPRRVDPWIRYFSFPEEVIRYTLFISIITLLRSRDTLLTLPASPFGPLGFERAVGSRTERFGAVSERWRRGEVSNKLRSRRADVCQNGGPHSCISFYPRASGSEKLQFLARWPLGGGWKSCSNEDGLAFEPFPFPFGFSRNVFASTPGRLSTLRRNSPTWLNDTSSTIRILLPLELTPRARCLHGGASKTTKLTSRNFFSRDNISMIFSITSVWIL